MNERVRIGFVKITYALEDLHGVAVEGQQSGLSRDVHLVLLGNVRRGLGNMANMADRIEAALDVR